MDIQQKLPEIIDMPLQLNLLQNNLSDPKRYRQMMLILQQTLYDLGYKQSAKMLQCQSGVNFHGYQLKQLTIALQKDDFQQAISVINNISPIQNSPYNNTKQNHINHESINQNANNINPNTNNIYQVTDNKSSDHKSSDHKSYDRHKQGQYMNGNSGSEMKHSAIVQTRSMIYETYCLEKIMRGEWEGAMEIIGSYIQSQQKREHLCEALVLGSPDISPQSLQSKKQSILVFWTREYQQIGTNQFQRVIQSYASHQPFMSRLCPPSFPPMKVLSVQAQTHIKHSITHLLVNPITDQLLVVDQNKESQALILFQISRTNWNYQKEISEVGHLSLKLKYPVMTMVVRRQVEIVYKNKRQAVEAVAWSYSKNGPVVAVAAFSIVQLFNQRLETVGRVQASNRIQRFVHVCFNPISDLLYCCGYFQYMSVLDSTGQHVMSIHPYPKTRKFLFHKTSIIGISLVSNKVYRHAVDEQVLLKDRQLDHNVTPMDLVLSQSQKYLAVSSLMYLYVLEPDSLQVLGKTASPFNPNKLIVEVRFFGDFLITLCKTFTAYDLLEDKLADIPNALIINKNKEWPGQGTFSIHNDFMISGTKQLIIWQEGNLQCQLESQDEFQEQVDAGFIEIQLQDLQEDEDIDSSSQQDSNQINQDSIDEQDQDIQM